MLKIQNLEVQTGQKTQGFIEIINSDMKTPITLINGAESGDTILIMGGIHSAEYVGIQSAIELTLEIKPEDVKGKIIILPLVNTNGFEHRTISMVYEDNKNLNRVFPGKKDGTLADKIAYTIEHDIYNHINYLIDLHGGDSYEVLTDYVYAQGNAPEEVVKQSIKMAEMVDVPYIVLSNNGTGGAYNHAGSIGIPGILLERGQLGVWSREEVNKTKRDVKNILSGLGFIKAEQIGVQSKIMLTNVIYNNADKSGCFYPSKREGDTFVKGEFLGEIRDYFGNLLESYYAEFDGVILYQVASLTVLENGPMIAYAELNGDGKLSSKNPRSHF